LKIIIYILYVYEPYYGWEKMPFGYFILVLDITDLGKKVVLGFLFEGGSLPKAIPTILQ
jgi:hypothetical protein